jgi:pimeloyl-ACP methyl ester carboxylesterase
MATYVLVHGGWHGGWCWEKVAPLLAAAGQRVIAPDLPGHGRDQAALGDRPWERYLPFLCDLLHQQPEPAILLGHSSGGMLISAAAERCPDRIAALVYLAAFLLPAGVAPPEIMRADSETILPQSLRVDHERGMSTVRPECARAVFYADCSDEDAAWAIERLQPEPLIPPATAAPPIVPEQARDIPRVYIETAHDRALGPATQRRMYAAMPCDAVLSLPTGHSPFISAPAALTRQLLTLA